jgi:8-oxo-dGTP pyrophosphatase MutT (NUDIX family)
VNARRETFKTILRLRTDRSISHYVISEEQLVAKLQARTRTASAARARAASVLVAISGEGPAATVLLTKRTETLPTHRGQIAFPGGKRDDSDTDDVATALREAREEVGLEPALVRVVGRLDDLVTISNYKITPVVAWVPGDVTLRANPEEVAEILHFPLHVVLDPPKAKTLLGQGLRRIVISYEHDGHLVWGATASILRQLARVIIDQEL